MFKLNLFAKVTNDKTRRTMISIVSSLFVMLGQPYTIWEETRKTRKALESLPHNFSSTWKSNVCILLDRLKNEDVKVLRQDPEFLSSLKKVLYHKCESNPGINKDDYFDNLLKISRNSHLFGSFIILLKFPHLGFEDWESICTSLDTSTSLNQWLDYGSSAWRFSNDQFHNNSNPKSDSFVNTQEVVYNSNAPRGNALDYGLSVLKQGGDRFKNACACLPWVVRLFHVNLKYSGNPINVKLFHYFMNKNEYFFGRLLTLGLPKVGLVCGDYLISEVARRLLLRLYVEEDLDVHAGLVRVNELSLTASRGSFFWFDKYIIIVETTDKDVIPILIGRKNLGMYSKVFWIYPNPNKNNSRC